MKTKQLGPYAKEIRRLLHCTLDDAVMIEDIMRNHVLHTVALDWLDAQEFKTAAAKAALLLANERPLFEAHYAAIRTEFQKVKAAELNQV